MSRGFDVVLYAFPFSVADGKGSGVERYAHELARNLGASGLRFGTIAKPNGSRWNKALHSFTSIPVRTLATRARVFHALSPYSARALRFFGRRPVITTVHDVIFREWAAESADFFERRRRRYNELAIRRSDSLIVPFQFTKARLRETYGVAEDRIHVVNYGVDLSRFYRAGKDLEGREERTCDVLFLGGVNALARGGKVVLEVYKRLLRERAGLKLAISVSGPHSVLLHERAEALGISHDLQWLDFVPEDGLAGLLANSAVFLYPTQQGFSFLHMQSMAAGTPVVTSNVFDIPEFIQGAALTCEPEDVGAYTEAILRLLSDRDTGRRIRSMALERVGIFTPQAMAEATARVYQQF